MVIPRFERGDNIPIDFVVEDKDGNPTPPDQLNGDPRVLIEITDSDTGDIMVSNGVPSEISDTEFVYNWQTTEGMNEGEYEVEIIATVSGNTELNRDKIVLQDIIC